MRHGAVQIAGVHDVEEAALLVECGVDFIGLPLRLDLHPEDCSEAEAARIVETLPARVTPVLITYLVEPEEIVELARRLRVRWVQLHGEIGPPAVATLRARAPELQLAKSLIVGGDDAEALARALSAFVTDSLDPATGARGATGRVHDWGISRHLAERSPRPLVLAGGLTPGNVARAIRTVRPAAVDAHTGVEAVDGRKHPGRVARFVAEARAAFASLDVGGC